MHCITQDCKRLHARSFIGTCGGCDVYLAKAKLDKKLQPFRDQIEATHRKKLRSESKPKGYSAKQFRDTTLKCMKVRQGQLSCIHAPHHLCALEQQLRFNLCQVSW